MSFIGFFGLFFKDFYYFFGFSMSFIVFFGFFFGFFLVFFLVFFGFFWFFFGFFFEFLCVCFFLVFVSLLSLCKSSYPDPYLFPCPDRGWSFGGGTKVLQ